MFPLRYGCITEIKSVKFDWYWLYTAKATVPFGKLEHIEFTSDQVQQFIDAGYEVCNWKETRRRHVLLKDIPGLFEFDGAVWHLREVFPADYVGLSSVVVGRD